MLSHRRVTLHVHTDNIGADSDPLVSLRFHQHLCLLLSFPLLLNGLDSNLQFIASLLTPDIDLIDS